MVDEEKNDEAGQVEEESRFTAKNRPKKTEYSMDGTAITVDGKLTKTRYFEFLEVPLDDYSDLKFSPGEIARIRSHIMNMRTGLQAMAPMFCFEAKTPVLMSNGTLKQIQDIQVNDRVITHTGRIENVTSVMSRPYTGAMFSFAYGKGTSTTSHTTPEHPFYIKHTKDTVPIWVKAANVKIGDYIASPKLDSINNNKSTDKELAIARLLGYYLAEGHIYINDGYELGFSFHKKETSYQQEVINDLKLLGYNPSIIPNKESQSLQIRVTRKTATDLFLKLGGKGAKNKNVAQEVFNWNQDAIKVLIKAYLNGDGCYRTERSDLKRKWSPEISWKTTSKKLAEQIKTLMISIGLRVSGPFYSIPKPNKYAKIRQPIYTGYLRNESVKLLLNNIPIKGDRLVFVDNKYIWHKVKKINTFYTENQQVYNFSVNKDESYCINWIAVHNCGGPMKCPVIFRCPFRQQDELERSKMDPRKFPTGRQCIIEREFLLHKRREYFEEYDVDPNSPTEIGLVNKLAELDMYEYRATLMLAHGDSGLGGAGQDLMKDQITAVTPQGRELSRVELHPAWDLKEKIHKQRMEILSALVGTRKEQYKKEAATKQRNTNDPSSQQAMIGNKLRRLIASGSDEEVINAEPVDNNKEK